jgi:tetratricopeptide (TPR) repeat protein
MGAAHNQVTVAVLGLVLLSACEERRGGPTVAESPFARRLLTVGQGLVTQTVTQHGEDAAAARDLERLANVARAAFERRGQVPAIEVLNRVIFDDEAFSREVDDANLAFVLLPRVLRGRRGSCVGLGTLYLALGELLHLSMRGVIVPGHFFVRVQDQGRWRNVELLRRGEEQPDAWYQARWPVPATTSPIYGRPLTAAEVLGVVEYDIGNDLRRQARVPEARRAFARAVADFPSLPEARASLGAVLQMEGALGPAADAYEAARRLEPSLAGLDENLRLLEDERRSRSTP